MPSSHSGIVGSPLSSSVVTPERASTCQRSVRSTEPYALCRSMKHRNSGAFLPNSWSLVLPHIKRKKKSTYSKRTRHAFCTFVFVCVKVYLPLCNCICINTAVFDVFFTSTGNMYLFCRNSPPAFYLCFPQKGEVKVTRSLFYFVFSEKVPDYTYITPSKIKPAKN